MKNKVDYDRNGTQSGDRLSTTIYFWSQSQQYVIKKIATESHCYEV